MKVFRIRDKNGLYSTGGMSPDFTKGGKTWSNIGHVKNHLRQFHGRYLEVYSESEIVEVEYTETDVKAYDILDFLEEINEQDLQEFNKSTYQSPYQKERIEKNKEQIALLKVQRDEQTR